MKKYKNHTLKEYSDVLSKRVPVPGGGSAGALTAALGASLISMVANYSIDRGSPKPIEKEICDILKESEEIRERLLDLVDLDAEAYLEVVKARRESPAKKKVALKKARQVPMEVCQLCYRAVDLMPYLVKYGNPYLMSDIEVASEMLLAAFRSALINVEINQ